MQNKDWKNIKRILQNVLDMEVNDRQRYLDGLEIGREIKAEVEALLAFEETAENWSPKTALELSRELFEDEISKSSLVGQKIGIYQITQEIGFGGMGAVYLAKRVDEKFEQKVAIKMLRREFNTEKIRRRFRQERKMQAALVHPNIASLIDAGTTDDGVPYLVMEYVEGVRIDKFCSENKLNLNERLKLFNKVCEAVSFAHRNLIIHRDIKPSNIIVTNVGEPKLLDFGISKLIDNGDETTKTITKLGAMTPEYASPEQIKGESVTTATDIYSLGVVLFKVLTGTMPFDTENKSDAKIFSEITNSKPKKPSEATLNNPKSKIQNPKSLKGDLDNIILKSLRKEPERRYRSVEQFAADIRRFMDGLPVTARPSTFSYRASKFYNRNKISVLAGLLILLSLITGITVAFWQANKARKQARISAESQRLAEIESKRANAETHKANTEKEKAEKISQFMAKVISYANPRWYAEGAKFKGDAKVIEVLDDLTNKIDTEFAGQPDIQAELHHKFSEVYNGRGKKEPREKQLFHAKQALQLRKQFYGVKHELIAKDMYYLCAALKTADKPDHEKIAKISAEAIEMMRETNPNNLNLPYMLQDYSIALIMPYDTKTKENYEKSHKFYLQAALPITDRNRYELAETYLHEAFPIFRRFYKEDNLAIAQNECVLAYSLLMQNKMMDFVRHYKTCTDLDKKPNINSKELINMIEDALAKKNK